MEVIDGNWREIDRETLSPEDLQLATAAIDRAVDNIAKMQGYCTIHGRSIFLNFDEFRVWTNNEGLLHYQAHAICPICRSDKNVRFKKGTELMPGY